MTRHGKTHGGSRLSPASLVVLAATGLALAIRLYLLSRTRYLAGITEYDDGVYLGGAIELLSGAVPYRDFAFVQPPGILLLMAPAALIAKVAAASSAMAVARLATACASAACVALAGSLVRHRGPLAALTACGLLAVYPDDIMAAHTLLLEPWMNLLVLAGGCLAFTGGRLAPPARLLWAGGLFGLAMAVKYWAVIPALGLLAACLIAGRREQGGAPHGAGGRATRFTLGATAGFALPAAPFAAGAPGAFIRSTLLDQASRAGSAVPEPLRLAHLTGLAAVLNDAGHLTLAAGPRTLFTRGDVTAAATWATGWLPLLAAFAVAAFLGLGYAAAARSAGGPGPLGWYALGTLAGALAAVLGYSAFFYHYADFAAPWLAIAAGYAATGLHGKPTGRPRERREPGLPSNPSPPSAALHVARAPARTPHEPLPPRGPRRLAGPADLAAGRHRAMPRALAALAAAIVIVAAVQAWELSGLHAPDVTADAALIPKGACVLTDEVSLTIAANRFPANVRTCPVVLDALAVTLVAGHGTSVQAGASTHPQIVAQWQATLSRAQYVWLSSSNARRIPWTHELHRWFARTFRPVNPPPGQLSEGHLYVRR